MHCPDCRFENPEGARFCAGCGTRLPERCAECGAQLVPGGRFCAQCGTKVEDGPAVPGSPGAGAGATLESEAAAPPSSPPGRRSGPTAGGVPTAREAEAAIREALSPAQGPPTPPVSAPNRSERRHVTILFADIVGSTAMGEAIDPEDLVDLMNGAFAVMNRAVAQAGGTVGRLMGDGLLAFFGAPISHEDDPLRALRAALAIRDGVKDFGAKVAAEGGPEVAVRVGLNSGLVVAGQVGSEVYSEYTTLGDAANTAARIQGAAPPNEVLVSEETARLLRGAVAMEPFGPLQLKGKVEPVPAFRITGEAPALGHSVRGLEGIDAPLVGRAGERARLASAFEDAVESRELGWITLTGDAGIGKSRLLATFLEDAAGSGLDPLVLKARCVEQIDDAYELVRSLLSTHYGLQGGMQPGEARETLASVIEADLRAAPRIDAARASRDLSRLVYRGSERSDEDPRALAERAMAALSALVLGWSERRPLVLALEDLHWADDSSLDAVARLAETLEKRPAFIIANARPPLFTRRPHWGEGERGHVRLDLRALSRASIGRLVRALLEGEDELPEDVIDFVAERSEGNAFYVEELVQMLRIRGILTQGEDGWSVDREKLGEGRVPTTLQGMLQARLDSLEPPERRALQHASILGKVFWDGALTALGTEDVSVLDRLRMRGLLFARERSGFQGQREFVFKHALLRDAAYGSLLKRARPALHGSAADWIIAHAGDRYGELAGQIARHAEAAGRSSEAARHYQVAAERARAGYANADAVEHYRRACALWPAEDVEGRFACLRGSELALDMLGRRDDQRACLDEMMALAEGMDEPVRSYLHFRRSWLAFRTGDLESAETEAREALELAGDDAGARADALMNLGNALKGQLRNEEALPQFEQAFELRRRQGDDRGAGQALVNLATALSKIGEPKDAVEGFEQALEKFVELDDIASQAVTLTNLAILMAKQGDLEAAGPRFERSLSLYRASGNRVGEGKALRNLGFLASEQGDLETAETHLREALEIFRSTSHAQESANALKDLAGVLEKQSRETEAEALVEEAERVIAGG